MKIDVFVSYHAATALDTAKAVVEKLEAQGLTCWYQDRDTGGRFGGVIKRAIEECGVFVVILNSQAARSRHVLNEVALAFDREELEILPLRMTEDPLYDDMEYYLHRIHQIDGYSRSRDAALDDLSRRTLKALNKTAPKSKIETIKYKDGCVYTGEVVDGKRHGKGKQTWPDGSLYEGDWRDDKRCGEGKCIWGMDSIHAGDIYEGEWRNDKIHGKGKYTWKNGGIYEGDWLNGKRNGKGKYTLLDVGTYEGDWQDGKYHGKGKYTWGKDSRWAGDVYEGNWSNNERTGIGTYTCADGRVQSGIFLDGVFQG